MSISTFEGIIENGQVRIRGDIELPENAKVYIVIPDFENTARARVASPHLVHPEQASDFDKQVIE